MMLVNRNWAVNAIISTMLASVHPASLTAANWASETLARVSMSAFAKATAAWRLGLLERPLWLSETQSVWPFGSNWLMLTADG
jgi:hypothetical protein